MSAAWMLSIPPITSCVWAIHWLLSSKTTNRCRVSSSVAIRRATATTTRRVVFSLRNHPQREVVSAGIRTPPGCCPRRRDRRRSREKRMFQKNGYVQKTAVLDGDDGDRSTPPLRRQPDEASIVPGEKK